MWSTMTVTVWRWTLARVARENCVPLSLSSQTFGGLRVCMRLYIYTREKDGTAGYFAMQWECHTRCRTTEPLKWEQKVLIAPNWSFVYNWNGNCLRAITKQFIHTWIYIDLDVIEAKVRPCWAQQADGKICDGRQKDTNWLFFPRRILFQHKAHTMRAQLLCGSRRNSTCLIVLSCATLWWSAEAVGRWFQGHVDRYQWCRLFIHRKSSIFGELR